MMSEKAPWIFLLQYWYNSNIPNTSLLKPNCRIKYLVKGILQQVGKQS